MDTRIKILTSAAAAIREFDRPLLLVTGHFDILRLEQARSLWEARQRTEAKSLVVVVRPENGELVPAGRRAEMAAAYRVVDYVLLAENEDLESLASSLQPIEIMRLEDSDADRTRLLIAHVHRRQSC